MNNLVRIILTIEILVCCNSLHAQVAPSIEWQKSLGGTGDDRAYSIQQKADGGFIIGGLSTSNDGDVSGNHIAFYGNSWDCWIANLDATGNIIWQKSLGGSSGDEAWDTRQTSDGGFIVAGNSWSNGGDVSGHHNSYFLNTDYWIVKLDSAGNIVWQKCLGGSEDEFAYSVQETTDGGFIVAGSSASFDGDITGHHGPGLYIPDCWIVKLNSAGDLLWEKSLGGSTNDYAYSIQQTGDGGFIVAGQTDSNDGDVSGNDGGGDYWIVRLDSTGNLVWQKSLGGTGQERARCVRQTTDGGFIVAGLSNSINGDVTGNHIGVDEYGDSINTVDYWVVKLDGNGSLQWQKSLGGSDWDEVYSIQQTTDGGFIAAGYSYSNDGDASGHHPCSNYFLCADYWIVKLDANGSLQWQKSLGGTYWDEAYSIQQTSDGGFITAGYSSSSDGDISGNHGDPDFWIVKLSAESCYANFSLSADTFTPHHYWGVNTSAGIAPLNYYWSWGDGSYDSIPYPSHVYSVGGFYTICLTIQDSTGCIDTTCYYYHLQKMSSEQAENTMVYVNIVPNIPTAAQDPEPRQELLVFPNPVQTQLFINLTMPATEVSIRVYDLQGKMILLPITFKNTQAQLNTTSLAEGFYTLQITNNKTGEHEVGKFVKQ